MILAALKQHRSQPSHVLLVYACVTLHSRFQDARHTHRLHSSSFLGTEVEPMGTATTAGHGKWPKTESARRTRSVGASRGHSRHDYPGTGTGNTPCSRALTAYYIMYIYICIYIYILYIYMNKHLCAFRSDSLPKGTGTLSPSLVCSQRHRASCALAYRRALGGLVGLRVYLPGSQIT